MIHISEPCYQSITAHLPRMIQFVFRALRQHLQNDFPESLVCFLTLAETKTLTRQWLEEYNEIRPHGLLRGLSTK